MAHVMAITIGPVQDFISTARRSRDLWFGSWLLSELSKAAANALVVLHNDKARLIFPFTHDPTQLIPDSEFNVVNKVLAIVDDPKISGDAAREAVQTRLREISEATFNRITDPDHYFGKNKEHAFAQVDDLTEFYWAAAEFSRTSEYIQARQKAETLLIARKTTRDFRAASWSSNAPKSALDGQRESVIDEEVFDKLQARQLRRSYGIRSGERLCGIGLLKRNGNRASDDSFFSTSHLASLPLLNRLKTEEQKKLIDEYITDLCAALNLDKGSTELGRVPYRSPYKAHPIFSRTVGNQRIGYDGHILFQERLDDLLEDKSDKQKAKADLSKAKESLGKFLKRAFDDEKPLPYYALLLADGDNMGEAIDGLRDPDSHRRFSTKLSAFAKAASAIVVKKHQGSLVYAGGDDILAFLPLHTVLQCANELASAFKETLRTERPSDSQPTLSVGVVIAHHMEPLQDALRLVRNAESTAKQVPGKNALAVTLSKRSGFDTTIKGSWNHASVGPLDKRLLRFARLYLNDELPDGAAYELRELSLRLSCKELDPLYDTLQKATHKEALRILIRKRITDQKLTAGLHPKLEREQKTDLSTSEVIDSISHELLVEGTTVGELANQLIVAREFARAFAQAGISAENLGELLIDNRSGELA